MQTVVLETRNFDRSNFVDQPEKVAKLVADFIGDQHQEFVLCLSLDAKTKPIALRVIHIGTVTSSMICPADVFRGPIMDGACSAIIAHNHPSGDTKPSPEDIAVTKKLKEAGELLGVDLLDHVIVGTKNGLAFTSIKRLTWK